MSTVNLAWHDVTITINGISVTQRQLLPVFGKTFTAASFPVEPPRRRRRRRVLGGRGEGQ